MSRKVITLFMVSLIFFSTIITRLEARPGPGPALHDLPSQNEVDNEEEMVMEEEDLCKGVGEDECLMRRTLVARIDYLYTQKQTP
ncbi:hypothetical protein SAY87_018746 [Trapa incisa]|uniref:Phytosulfokine n=1 Tax=Trapa incisa TaxID=236973 RepID=A0AAN7Q618_9MYRT|nr:hypothetical protein SAY87_018746 [Trapa incisa]